jgi:PKD repeat protein
VTATVSDGTLSDSKTFTWTVTNVNQAPTLTAPANQTSAENAAVSLQLVASDPDGTALTYSATGLPPSLTVTAATGLISGTLSFTSAGTYSVTATASDGTLSDSKTLTWTVTNVNQPPTLTAPANQTSAENAIVSLQLVATDPDGGALTYSATGLPPSLIINAATGLISGTLPSSSAGVYPVTATVSDGSLTNSQTFTWTVTNVNQPPTLTAPANQTSAENATVSLQLVATDPDGTTLTYSATGLPPSLTVTAATGLIAGTLSFTSAGSYSVTATASDGSLSNSKTFTWTVTNVNRAPTLTAPVNQTSAENATVSLQLAASDPDGDVLTYSATGLPPSLTVTAATGLISGTLSPTSAGTYSVTATASDGSLSNSKTFTWTVTNVQTTPTITWAAPADLTFGTPLSGTQLNATASVPGPFVYTPAAATVLSAGAGQTLSVVFTPTDATSYTTATASVAVTVVRATPTTTWPSPANIIYGTPLSGTQLDATASVPGGFVYAPAAGTVLSVGGSKKLSGAFSPTNPANYNAATANTTIKVTRAWGGKLGVANAVIVDGTGASTAEPFDTLAGDLVVAFASSDGPGNQRLTISGGGLTWSRVTTVSGTPGVAEIWQASSPTAQSGISVTSTQLVGGYTQSITVATFWGASGVGASAVASGSGGPSVSLTTTQPGSLVYGVGNDRDGAIARTLGANQAMLHEWVDAASTDTYWVQNYVGPVANAGSLVQLNDTAPIGDRWNFAAVEILADTKITPTITWAAPASLTLGTPLGPTQLNATASVPGTFVYAPAAGTVLPVGAGQILSVTFTPTDTVNYTTATSSVSITVTGFGFTDDPIIAGTTLIKAVHFTELRSRIDAIRIAKSLAPYAWSDPSLTAGTTSIRAQHIVDLRAALAQAYVAAGLLPPTYTDPVIGSGTTVKVAHIADIRLAIIAIE